LTIGNPAAPSSGRTTKSSLLRNKTIVHVNLLYLFVKKKDKVNDRFNS